MKNAGGKNAIAFVLVTVLIDSAGLGIIIPVIPDLIRDLTGEPLAAASRWGGLLAFTYALMQFLFGPVIGNLSDRFGRRPVLLLSLAAMAVDYVIMAMAPVLAVLFVGRAISGITGATFSTANAAVADISPPDKRAASFGLVGAAFGAGFIIGPLVGGLLGEWGTRAPFFAAALLALANSAYGYLVFPETLARDKRRPFRLARANPLGAARQARLYPAVAWLLVAGFLFDVAHFVYPATWSFFTKAAFDWSSAEIGVSLAVIGIGFVFVQGYLIRRILPWLGERRTAYAGLLVNMAALAGIAFATSGAMIYALLPVTALGAIVGPAMKGLESNRMPDDSQGELQGMVAASAGLAAIVSPLMMTQILAWFIAPAAPVHFPGAPYLAAAFLCLATFVPLAIGLRRRPSG